MLIVSIIAIALPIAVLLILLGECRKSGVWLVDDREENRKRFLIDHQGEFYVRLFATPEEVLAALKEGDRPDALLCDIYFYADSGKREEAEKKVEQHAEDLRTLSGELGTENARGINLIKTVYAMYGGSVRFPIYAYTSKGPYLLQGEGFDDLENLDVRWLFKSRYKSQADIERHRLNKDIADSRRRYGWQRFWSLVGATGGVSAILGVVLDRVARHFGH